MVRRDRVQATDPVRLASEREGVSLMIDHLHQGGEEYELRFVVMPGDVAPIQRIKAILKIALRNFRLRCTSAVNVTPYPDGAKPPTPQAIDPEDDPSADRG
jgi:hypothetical protein